MESVNLTPEQLVIEVQAFKELTKNRGFTFDETVKRTYLVELCRTHELDYDFL